MNWLIFVGWCLILLFSLLSVLFVIQIPLSGRFGICVVITAVWVAFSYMLNIGD